ncbi:helix-turn-helix domain-containing protein [Gordonia sp. KTR9]|uniref:helix-turn-helix domain-containing protein n=1 Tax=Gordonia sp. KTR9 TaxID=337191 RepID=UPI000A0159F8
MTAGVRVNAFEWSRLYFRNPDTSLRQTRSTMAALQTYADFKDLTCYPSQSTLAEITGSSVETVRRHIKKNVDAGWLVVVERGNSYKRSSLYRLSVPARYQLPSETRGVTEPPSQMRSTPLTDEGSTPLADDRLTTHAPTQRTTHKGCSIEDPFGGPPVSIPPIATNQISTPLENEGGWPVIREEGRNGGTPTGSIPAPVRIGTDPMTNGPAWGQEPVKKRTTRTNPATATPNPAYTLPDPFANEAARI